MKTWTIILLIIIAVLLVAVIALYFLGKRLQKKKDESDAQMAAAAQTVPMLIIDKKKMKLKDAGLPAIVYEKTPKLLRGQKVPIVKAKIGPRIQTFMCDAAIFDDIPIKKEVRATVSGLYITSVKGLRKPLEKNQNTGKKKLSQRIREKYEQTRKAANNTKEKKG